MASLMRNERGPWDTSAAPRAAREDETTRIALMVEFLPTRRIMRTSAALIPHRYPAVPLPVRLARSAVGLPSSGHGG